MSKSHYFVKLGRYGYVSSISSERRLWPFDNFCETGIICADARSGEKAAHQQIIGAVSL
jgi:hypothetical protein